jgi:hypothetical protein
VLLQLGADEKLSSLIDAESLVNDGSAFSIFLVLQGIVGGKWLSANEVNQQHTDVQLAAPQLPATQGALMLSSPRANMRAVHGFASATAACNALCILLYTTAASMAVVLCICTLAPCSLSSVAHVAPSTPAVSPDERCAFFACCYCSQITVSFVHHVFVGAALGLAFGLATSAWLARIWLRPGEPARLHVLSIIQLLFRPRASGVGLDCHSCNAHLLLSAWALTCDWHSLLVVVRHAVA